MKAITATLRVDSIPAEIIDSTRAVIWNSETRGSKRTKVPYCANNPASRASVADPTTWASFRDAIRAVEDGKADGAGFVLGDGYAGVDLDDCRNPDTGVLTDTALVIIQQLGSYTETSPSGTGVKVFLRGALPPGRRRKNNIEMYDGSRFFTVTGHHVDGTPLTINERTTELSVLHTATFGSKRPRSLSTPASDEIDDDDLIGRALRAQNGPKFQALWNGEWEDRYDSPSEADLAFCSHLAFWTNTNAEQMDRLFRRSGLMRPKWDARHFADGRTYGAGTIDRAVAASSETYRQGGSSDSDSHETENRRTLPRIDASDRYLPRVTRRALEALQAANEPPRLFRYGGLLVRVQHDDTPPPELQRLSDDRLRHELARAAYFYRVDKNGDEQPALPPVYVVKDLLASPNLDLPRLTAVIGAPAFTGDGDLHDQPGYHRAGTYYAPPPRLEIPGVPDRPTHAEIDRARSLLLDDLLVDFPFIGQAERAHAVALLFLPFVRDLILGPTPLHLIEKPTPGTGGSLLAAMLLLPSAGEALTAMTEGKDEDEWRKRITARLRGSPCAVLIDNLRRRLDSSALAAVITADVHEDRILGTSDTVRIPVRCAWIATGNNPGLSAELTRRAIRIRLDAHVDRPWLRKQFRHSDLRAWALRHRGELIWAALVLVQAWLDAGRPDGTPVLGMFEQWSRVLGGILDVAAVPGFLGNLSTFYEESDAEGMSARLFIKTWWQQFGEREVGVAELWPLVSPEKGDPIDLDLGDGSDRSQKTRLGKRLADLRDRKFDELRLVKGRESTGANRWRLQNEAQRPPTSDDDVHTGK